MIASIPIRLKPKEQTPKKAKDPKPKIEPSSPLGKKAEIAGTLPPSFKENAGEMRTVLIEKAAKMHARYKAGEIDLSMGDALILHNVAKGTLNAEAMCRAVMLVQESQRGQETFRAARKSGRKAGTALVVAAAKQPDTIDVQCTPIVKPEKLPAGQRRELAWLEKVIDRGLKDFLEVGRALGKILDQRLYRGTHASFDAYLADRWAGLDRSIAYRRIKAAAIAEETSAITDKLGITLDNEAQYRALEKLDDAKDREAVLRRAAKMLNGSDSKSPTAAILAEAVKRETVCPEDRRDSAKERKRDSKPEPIRGGAGFSQSLPGEAGTPGQLPESSPRTWQDDLEAFRAATAAAMQPLQARHAANGKFHWALHLALHDLSVEARYYEPQAAGRKAK